MEKMNKNLLALKPYLESVKKHCSRLSNEGLTDIILGLAKEVPAKQRIGFLETIDRLSQKQPPVAWDDEILSEIEALKGDIGNEWHRSRTAPTTRTIITSTATGTTIMSCPTRSQR